MAETDNLNQAPAAPAPDLNNQAPAAPESSTAQSAAPESSSPAAPLTDGQPPAAPAAPAFTPSYKVKAYGKEHEIPEQFRGLIKDQKSQEEMHKHFSKVFAFDQLQGKQQSTQQELAQTRQQLQHIMQEIVTPVQDLAQAAKEGDLDTIFAQLGITDDTFFKYAFRRVEEAKLPIEQQRALEQGRAAARQNRELTRSQQNSQSGVTEYQVQAGLHELNMVMELDPVVIPVKAALDAEYGEGAFEQEVLKHGMFYESQGRYVPPRAVAHEVAKRWAPRFSANPAAPQAPAAQAPQAPNQAALPPTQSGQGQRPATLPNLNSNASSPAKKQFKTTDEMRKYAESLPD